MKNFLSEIEEYSKRLDEEKKKTVSEETNSDEGSLEQCVHSFFDDSVSEIDNLYQEVEAVKQELETEKEKMKSLEDIIKNKS